jgi:hypothetical protein
MTDNPIPQTAQVFILENIESIAEMESILIFFDQPDITMDAAELSARVYIAEHEAKQVLEHLSKRGFLAKSATLPSVYKYAPQSPQLENSLREVADLYRKYLLPVTHLIHSKSRNKVQGFADAFLIRKDKSDG